MAQLQGGGASLGPRAAQRPQLTDPLEQLKQMLIQAGVGSSVAGSGIDWQQQAQQAYAPQLGYLDQAARSAQDRAAASGKQVGTLYGALAKDIYGQAGGIKSNYCQSISSAGDAYNQALAQTGAAFDQTRNNSAEILQRLGIQEAAPNVVGQSNDAQALLEGIINANNLGTTNALRQGQQSMLDYNTAMGNASKIAGTEAQAGVQNQLASFLDQIAMKRADVQSQQSQYANSLQSDALKAQQGNQFDVWDRMFKLAGLENTMANDRADYELQLAKLSGNGQRLDPLGQVQQLAQQLYGNPQGAANAVKAVTDAYMQAQSATGEAPNLAQLMDVVRQRLMQANNGQINDEAQLQRIAAQLINSNK